MMQIPNQDLIDTREIPVFKNLPSDRLPSRESFRKLMDIIDRLEYKDYELGIELGPEAEINDDLTLHLRRQETVDNALGQTSSSERLLRQNTETVLKLVKEVCYLLTIPLPEELDINPGSLSVIDLKLKLKEIVKFIKTEIAPIYDRVMERMILPADIKLDDEGNILNAEELGLGEPDENGLYPNLVILYGSSHNLSDYRTKLLLENDQPLVFFNPRDPNWSQENSSKESWAARHASRIIMRLESRGKRNSGFGSLVELPNMILFAMKTGQDLTLSVSPDYRESLDSFAAQKILDRMERLMFALADGNGDQIEVLQDDNIRRIVESIDEVSSSGGIDVDRMPREISELMMQEGSSFLGYIDLVADITATILSDKKVVVKVPEIYNDKREARAFIENKIQAVVQQAVGYIFSDESLENTKFSEDIIEFIKLARSKREGRSKGEFENTIASILGRLIDGNFERTPGATDDELIFYLEAVIKSAMLSATDEVRSIDEAAEYLVRNSTLVPEYIEFIKELYPGWIETVE